MNGAHALDFWNGTAPDYSESCDYDPDGSTGGGESEDEKHATYTRGGGRVRYLLTDPSRAGAAVVNSFSNLCC